MLFNSIDFAIFFPIFFIFYWLTNAWSLNVRNVFILCSSILFYGWWEWSFIYLLLFSSLVDYLIGVGLSQSRSTIRRKLLLATSLTVNLGMLCYFKYANFFIENFNEAFTFFGSEISITTLNVVLPVGISFYTFQTLSYSIDVYRGDLKPTKDIIAFFGFVSFFPQLVAGPIERATNLLPQFNLAQQFNYDNAVIGLRQILWGLVKKVIIADNCSVLANQIFDNSEIYSGSTLLLGAIFFSFQIYGDFSGYSDIAIGSARLLGIKLMENFKFPYFSRDIAEFWRRWHISLSTWFRDYLYFPLGGSKGTMFFTIRNTFIIFLVSGFWHGSNWTFVVWGFLHALYFIPLLIQKKNRKNLEFEKIDFSKNGFMLICRTIFTFLLVTLAWVFFRAESLQDALLFLKGIFSFDLFSIPQLRPYFLLLILSVFILIEWKGRFFEFGIQYLFVNQPNLIRWSVYYLLIFGVILNSYLHSEAKEFIYFQF